ncbi:MAG: helix-turn-helix domain-containing protein [Xanthobacteraceae bacterium]
MRSSNAPTVKSADRVLDLLELLCSTGHPMTHTEIASALSIPKSRCRSCSVIWSGAAISVSRRVRMFMR